MMCLRRVLALRRRKCCSATAHIQKEPGQLLSVRQRYAEAYGSPLRMIEVPVNSDIEIEAECAGEVLVQLVRQFNVEKEDVTDPLNNNLLHETRAGDAC
ncbi:MAG: hypothetical protein N2V77_03815 [Canidatus Methanoxibalbensis ujae]|nr:hypothetical protein [Candidatus Methanoxibalbensis ujae]